MHGAWSCPSAWPPRTSRHQGHHRGDRPGSSVLQVGVAGQGWPMPVLRAIARPMLASIFAIQGFDTLLHPERVVPQAEPVVRPVADLVPGVPSNTEQAVRISGAVQVLGASLLAVGKLPRLSALAIAATLVPTTLAGHRFWEAEDDKTRAQQRLHWSVALCSGPGTPGGRPSLPGGAPPAAKGARGEVALAKRSSKAGAKA